MTCEVLYPLSSIPITVFFLIKMKKKYLTTATVIILALAPFQTVAAAADIDAARRAVEAGQPKAAFELLSPFETELAGDKNFDYLLGVSALDAGYPDRATLAFERVLAVDPNAVGARLDMGRAYFALGDLARARSEFNLVAQANPPSAARQIIDKYLIAIDAREKSKKTAATGYIEVFGGHDSNVTSVVADFTSAILTTYNLAGFSPTGAAVLRSSSVVGLGAGGEVVHQLSDTVSLYAGADFRHRSLPRAQAYSSDQTDLRAGLTLAIGNEMIRTGVSYQQFNQLTDLPTANRQTVGLTSEWRHTFSDVNQGSLFASLTRQRFADIPTNDVNSFVVGGGWFHSFPGKFKPFVYASAFFGGDNALNLLANGSDVGKRLSGLRVFGQIAASERVDVFSSVGFTRRADRSMNARASTVTFGNDSISDFSLGAVWRFGKNWSLRSQLIHSSNRSNVAVSQFKRTEATFATRYDF